MANQKRTKYFFKITIRAILVLIFAVLIVFAANSVFHFFIKKQPTTNSSYTKGIPTAPTHLTVPSASSGQNTNSVSPTQKSSVSSKSNSNLVLLTPTGDFVSNHHPGQNNTPSTEVSVCNTTPGASCKIIFSDGATIRSLPSQTTDRGGSTYWNNWTPKEIGLVPGSWKITAQATLNGQLKTSTDQLKLVVE